MKLSKYTTGWMGLRASKAGRSSKLLKRTGWIKLGHADLNNRNGFDWVRPGRTHEQFLAADWRELAAAGLVGIAVWFSDAQWGLNAGVTDAQWCRRAIIEADFNSKWPTGHRN
jgi:hypothetical protein